MGEKYTVIIVIFYNLDCSRSVPRLYTCSPCEGEGLPACFREGAFGLQFDNDETGNGAWEGEEGLRGEGASAG